MKLLYMTALLAALMMFGCQGSEPPKPVDTPSPALEAPATPEALSDTETTPAVTETAPAPSAGSAAGLNADFLTGQKFVLKTVNGAEFQGENIPTLEFGENFLVSGKICNNFRGPGELTEGRLVVKAIASTRMACPNVVLGDLETGLFQALETGVDISMDGSDLFLKYADTVLVFQAQTDLAAGD